MNKTKDQLWSLKVAKPVGNFGLGTPNLVAPGLSIPVWVGLGTSIWIGLGTSSLDTPGLCTSGLGTPGLDIPRSWYPPFWVFSGLGTPGLVFKLSEQFWTNFGKLGKYLRISQSRLPTFFQNLFLEEKKNYQNCFSPALLIFLQKIG